MTNLSIDTSFWDQKSAAIENHIVKLWGTPELSLMEYESSNILCEWLEEEGFTVERNYCEIPTAFRATYGSGDYTVGIIAEYDALVGLSNDAVTFRKSLGQEAGHACLHCHIGACNTGAAIAVKDYMIANNIDGKVVVIGCPAEEILWGKIALLDRGGFDGIDVLLTSHVDYQNASVSRPTLSFFSGEFCFGGVSSHSGAARAHNALDGVELAVIAIERMRAHQFSDVSVEHVIRKGGLAPNITPDMTTLWINVRHKEYEKARHTYQYLKDIIQNCAKIAGVKVVEGFIAGSRGYLPNDVLGELMYKNMKITGVDPYSAEEIKQLNELSVNATGVPEVESNPEIMFLNDGVDPYSQDDGEVSWRIPLGRVNWEIPMQIPLHNWATTALAGMPSSRKGGLMASKTIYLTAIDLLLNTSIIEDAKQEFETRKKGIKVTPPLYGSFDEFTKDPIILEWGLVEKYL